MRDLVERARVFRNGGIARGGRVGQLLARGDEGRFVLMKERGRGIVKAYGEEERAERA